MKTSPNLGAPAARFVLAGGVVAGAFDITYAIAFAATRGVSPERVLQSVASGLLGQAAFRGAGGTAALGLALHFLIAIAFAWFFARVAQRVPVLVRRPGLWGAIYGFGIFWLMNLVVLPLSAFPRAVNFAPAVVITGLLVHMFMIGVPIALASRRALAGPRRRVQATP